MIKNIRFQLEKSRNNTITFRSDDVIAHLYVLEEDVFRVYFPEEQHPLLNKTWTITPGAEDVAKEGRDKDDLSPFDLPTFELKETANEVEIFTEKLKAVVELDGLKFHWYAKINNEWIHVANDRKTQNYNFHKSLGEGVYHYMERDRNESYYGLGEKGGPLNKAGKRYRMQTIDAMGYDAEHTDPLYKHIPYYITYNHDNKIAYGLYYDNYSDAIFDLGNELDNYHGYYRYYQASKGNLDYYFMLGPRIKDVVETFSQLTGQTIMPPKWSLGYSGSTMTYTDAPDAQDQLKKFVELCKEYDIPCDSFQLSSGYTSIGDKRYVFNWDYSKIPSPEEMINNFQENGIRLCANIKPALLKDHPLYEELAANNYFILSKDLNEPEISQFWDDIGSYLDFTNADTFDWWKNKVKEQLLSYGIDSTWNDNNEYEIWDENAQANGFGDMLSVSYIKPIQTMLMMKASYEAQREFYPNVRPYLISRSGAAGMQKYVQTWSGDNFTEWKTIRYNIKMGLSLSMSGVYNFGHDVGGFSGKAPDPELFVRWIQNGIFHPRFTIHSWNDDKTVNVPWMYPEYLELIRELMKKRVKWIPFIYNAMHKAHKDYKPILTPTLYHFDHDANTFEENDDFLVGDQLLIANVVEQGARSRDVYLPDNKHGWYDVNTDKYYEAGTNITADAPLEVIPMYAQAGAIIPIRDGEITFSNKEEERGVLLFPYQQSGVAEEFIYEDDGYTNKYKDGDYTYLKVKMNCSDEWIDITTEVDGDYLLPYDKVTFYLPKEEHRKVKVNGQEGINNHTFVAKVKGR
ncbi:glycoside hydrolase family 31 protein [Gracilibacillus sp. S3-1-1]|uniref:Glycoside hydrolase family 31 protein n=1 Tax=Gracilibacillus pellucidus TaxID=3095368 RepID=A0ACC6M0W1_9BACI|nr:glycoside hydrolase family 31 protein [Gracilibacillus sp. S3-1-1]MDX8044536.1 glycoside hydrolase family 31 protein [Gracilibacillus sp. S3-1-1]